MNSDEFLKLVQESLDRCAGWGIIQPAVRTKQPNLVGNGRSITKE